MTYELTDLELEEISLVGNPANQHSMIELFKAHSPANQWDELRKSATDFRTNSTMDLNSRF